MGIDAKGIRGYQIHASVLPNTTIIKVDVEGPDPRRAADVANAAAAVTRREARSMHPPSWPPLLHARYGASQLL